MADLTPEQSETVRRLLAEARHDEPLPAEVATRLDDVLAELIADRAVVEEPAPAVVVPFRRRRWPQVLVAAAAVTVIGYASTQVLGGGMSGEDDLGTTADSAAESGQPPSDNGRDGTELDGDTPAAAPGPQAPPAEGETAGGNLLSQLRSAGLPTLSPQLGDEHLRRLLDTTSSLDNRAAYARRLTPGTCGPYYEVHDGKTFAALLHGNVALVIAHPVLNGLRLVEVYDCESPEPRRAVETVTLRVGE